MDEWLRELSARITGLRGSNLAGEDHWIAVEFVDGHAQHRGTLADLADAADAVSQRYAEALLNNENGEPAEIMQEIVNLFTIVTNARRVNQ